MVTCVFGGHFPPPFGLGLQVGQSEEQLPHRVFVMIVSSHLLVIVASCCPGPVQPVAVSCHGRMLTMPLSAA